MALETLECTDGAVELALVGGGVARKAVVLAVCGGEAATFGVGGVEQRQSAFAVPGGADEVGEGDLFDHALGFEFLAQLGGELRETRVVRGVGRDEVG